MSPSGIAPALVADDEVTSRRQLCNAAGDGAGDAAGLGEFDFQVGVEAAADCSSDSDASMQAEFPAIASSDACSRPQQHLAAAAPPLAPKPAFSFCVVRVSDEAAVPCIQPPLWVAHGALAGGRQLQSCRRT